MIGEDLTPGHVPASVVKKLVDGVMGAVRTLSARALHVDASTGRPDEQWRRYYDLPAVEFGFRSFEMAFGTPDVPKSLQFEEKTALQHVEELLTKGLEWATAPEDEPLRDTPEWSAITEALAKLAPPQSGVVEVVEVSGRLAGGRRKPRQLTRKTSERIATARKRLRPARISKASPGFVREFDKDKFKFILRDSQGSDIWPVIFAQDQYDDVYLAFETNKLVDVVAYDGGSQPYELASLTFSSGDERPARTDA
jgi:hypothetical protein